MPVPGDKTDILLLLGWLAEAVWSHFVQSPLQLLSTVLIIILSIMRLFAVYKKIQKRNIENNHKLAMQGLDIKHKQAQIDESEDKKRLNEIKMQEAKALLAIRMAEQEKAERQLKETPKIKVSTKK